MAERNYYAQAVDKASWSRRFGRVIRFDNKADRDHFVTTLHTKWRAISAKDVAKLKLDYIPTVKEAGKVFREVTHNNINWI